MTSEHSQNDASATESPSATERVIALFGGVRPMAAKLEISASTIQGWKERDSIPEARHADILAAAEKHDVSLDPADLGGAKVATPKQDDAPMPSKPDPDKPPPTSAASETPAPIGAVPPTLPPPTVSQDRISSRQARSLVIAVVALIVGMAGLVWAVVDGQTEASTDLTDRVAALEAQPAPQPVDLSGIETRLTALEAEVGSEANGAATQDLVDQIAALADRVTALEQAATGNQTAELAQQVQSLSQAMTALQTTVGGLQDTQAALHTAVQGLPTAEMLDAMSSSVEQRLSTFQSQMEQAVAVARQNNGEGPALVLAVSQLRDAVNGGQPYQSDMTAVTALAGENQSLADPLSVLADHAASGVASFETLAEQFPDVADAIRAADQPASDGWFDSALNSVGGLVTVRRAPGENDGEDADSVAARAEARIQAGDWSGVAQALSSLTGAPAEAASSWVDELQARLAVNQALSTIQSAAVSALAPAQ